MNVCRVCKSVSGLKKGRETTEDDPYPGRHSTSEPDENIQKNWRIHPRRPSARSGAEQLSDKRRQAECSSDFAQFVQHGRSRRGNDVETFHARTIGIENEHRCRHFK